MPGGSSGRESSNLSFVAKPIWFRKLFHKFKEISIRLRVFPNPDLASVETLPCPVRRRRAPRRRPRLACRSPWFARLAHFPGRRHCCCWFLWHALGLKSARRSAKLFEKQQSFQVTSSPKVAQSTTAESAPAAISIKQNA